MLSDTLCSSHDVNVGRTRLSRGQGHCNICAYLLIRATSEQDLYQHRWISILSYHILMCRPKLDTTTFVFGTSSKGILCIHHRNIINASDPFYLPDTKIL
jgi:hypothetical protein